MFLYSNLKHITETRISQNELAKLSRISQQTINDNIKNQREFKGTQIHAMFQALKFKGIVYTLDDLFYTDLRIYKPNKHRTLIQTIKSINDNY